MNAKENKKKSIRQAALIFSLFLLVAGLAFWKEQREDSVAQGYLPREAVGGANYEKELILETAEGEEKITVEVTAQERSKRERAALLSTVAEALPAIILHGQSAARVEEDLVFAESLQDFPGRISYMTSNPAWLSVEGKIGEAVPAEGGEVTLRVSLSLDGEIREEEMALTIFPRRKSSAETRKERILAAIENENERTSAQLRLPSTIEGQAARWRSPPGKTAVFIVFCGLIFVAFFLYEQRDAARRALEKKRRALRFDYPEITSQLSLYLGAGLPLRSALTQIVAENRARRKAGGRKRAGFMVLEEVCLMMSHGVSEEEAYLRLGEVADELHYRRLSALFSQLLSFGSTKIGPLLSKEAADAFSDRKKEAMLRGEEASTKLLFPMLLLFGDILVILLIPALWSLR